MCFFNWPDQKMKLAYFEIQLMKNRFIMHKQLNLQMDFKKDKNLTWIKLNKKNMNRINLNLNKWVNKNVREIIIR